MSCTRLPSPVPRMMPTDGEPLHLARIAAAASLIWSNRAGVLMAARVDGGCAVGVSCPAVTFDRDGSMRLPRFANPLARRLRLDRLTAADLPRMAHSPSYRAPNAADVLDPARARPPEL